MNDFATVDDIIALWRPLTPEEIERAKKLLPIISDVLRQEAMNVGKDLDQMLSDGEVLPVPVQGQQAIPQDIPGRLAVGCVGPYKHYREQVYQTEHQRSTQRGRCPIPDDSLGEAYSHHEIDYGRYGGKEYSAGHTLAVEHQEEAGIDQCAAGLLLHHYQYHRCEDDGQAEQEVAPA